MIHLNDSSKKGWTSLVVRVVSFSVPQPYLPLNLPPLSLECIPIDRMPLLLPISRAPTFLVDELNASQPTVPITFKGGRMFLLALKNVAEIRTSDPLPVQQVN